jgi:hypothetical protein
MITFRTIRAHRALAEPWWPREPVRMLIASTVAATLLVAVGVALVVYGLRPVQTRQQARRASDEAAVTDCLANVDRLIDLRLVDLRDGMAAPASVTPLRVDDALSA